MEESNERIMHVLFYEQTWQIRNELVCYFALFCAGIDCSTRIAKLTILDIYYLKKVTQISNLRRTLSWEQN